ncbi:MAG: glutathione peroxidase [Clostridia bacterium]|nr:glutathione peroxidase [Clostridia bacterium]
MSVYDFVMKDAEGADVSLADYKGKVLLIVNTATGCGFTPQYNALEELYEKYKDKGFEILDFPCNQFGGQAPGTDAEITEFCTINFGVSFKQFSKIDVNGESEAPLYTYLKGEKGGILGTKIKWNFTKFLVDREGNVVERYAPTVTPERMEPKIVELLK